MKFLINIILIDLKHYHIRIILRLKPYNLSALTGYSILTFLHKNIKTGICNRVLC